MGLIDVAAPLLIIAVSIPLILRWIPRNGLYGFRTPSTRSSDEVWYPANRFAGMTLAIAGMVWLLAVMVTPSVTESVRDARVVVVMVGTGAVVASLVASLLYLRRL